MQEIKDDKLTPQTKVDSYLAEIRSKISCKVSLNNKPSSPQIYTHLFLLGGGQPLLHHLSYNYKGDL